MAFLSPYTRPEQCLSSEYHCKRFERSKRIAVRGLGALEEIGPLQAIFQLLAGSLCLLHVEHEGCGVLVAPRAGILAVQELQQATVLS